MGGNDNINQQENTSPETYYERFYKMKDGKMVLRIYLVVRMIPLINSLYDLYFDGSDPNMDGVQNLLNVIGLINALILGGVLGEMAAPGYDDLIAADARFSSFNGTLYNEDGDLYPMYWQTWYSLRPSEQLYAYTSNSLTLLFIGILGVIYIFVDALSKQESLKDRTNEYIHILRDKASTNSIRERAAELVEMKKRELNNQFKIDGKTVGENPLKEENGPMKEKYDLMKEEYDIMKEERDEAQGILDERSEELERRSAKLFNKWWSWAKFGTIFIMSTTGIACGYAALASQILYAIKYPDYYIAEYGKISYYTIGSCPTGKASITFRLVLGLVLLFIVMMCGLGTQSKYLKEDDYKIMDAGTWIAYREQKDSAKNLRVYRKVRLSQKKSVIEKAESLSALKVHADVAKN